VAGPLRTRTGFLCRRRLESCHIEMDQESPDQTLLLGRRKLRSRRLHAVCTVCNMCRPSENYVNVVFCTAELSASTSEQSQVGDSYEAYSLRRD
jgi:hypothetical protein